MITFNQTMPRERARAMNAVVLAFVGDAAYSLYVREALVFASDYKTGTLQKLSSRQVSAKGQSELIERLLPALTEEEAQRWHLMGYQDRMGETLAAADAIVSRAGATSLAEISARAIPALLIPFPYATEDHQTTNARAYVEAGCAYMLSDAEVMGGEFRAKVLALIDDADVRAAMSAAARARKTADAAANLADVVMAAARA